jgi:hypothetical protein
MGPLRFVPSATAMQRTSISIDAMTFSFTPPTLMGYRKRLLTSRSVVVALVFILALSTELHFNWIESLAGAFLLSTNDRRPESGAIWEQGHLSESAQNALSQHMNRRQDIQREVRRAASMGQVIGGIEAGGGAMISAAHFLELYRKLPPVLSQEIASPYALLAYWSSEKWQRTFFDFQGAGLAIYLLDAHSQVLRRFDIAADLVDHIRRGEVAIQTGLDQLGDFSNHIFPAERFFAALNALPASVREAALAQPADLLKVSGTIRRVGISSISSAGAVDLGFEVEDAGVLKVILTQGSTAAISRLRWVLEHRDDSKNGSLPYGETRP